MFWGRGDKPNICDAPVQGIGEEWHPEMWVLFEGSCGSFMEKVGFEKDLEKGVKRYLQIEIEV